MEVKTFQKHYKLCRFDHYVDNVDDETIVSVLEMILKVDDVDLDYLKDEFAEIFAIETSDQCYVFSHYTVHEYYLTDNGMVCIVCIK